MLWCHLAREAGLAGNPKLSWLPRSCVSVQGAETLHARLCRKPGRAAQVTKTGALLQTQRIRQSLQTIKMLLELDSGSRRQYMVKQELALPIGSRKPQVSLSSVQDASSSLTPTQVIKEKI